MRTIGARLLNVTPGKAEADMPFRDDLTRHGSVAAEIACRYPSLKG